MIGMVTPASAYCVEQGGKRTIRAAADRGYHMPDGRVVEEWIYFRAHHKA